MNKEKKNELKRKSRSQISRKLLLQFVLSLVAITGGVILLALLSWNFLSRFIWQPDDVLYIILHFIKESIFIVVGGLILIGWTILSYIYISKPLRYLDELVLAAEEIAHPSENAIQLHPELKNIEKELNNVREKALKDARLAKEAEQRKNDLVVYLAHDLKTPLTSVLGYVTLLCDEPDIEAKTRMRYLNIVREKGQRLENLINEFFEITRFNLTTLELEPERVNLTRMLEQTTYEFNPLLAEKKLTWELHLENGIFALCDVDKMERVFDNLIRNAVNYSYPASTIEVDLQRETEQVVLKVKNHGKTIAPEKLSRIFDQFFRLDSARSSTTGGAGLGLAIAKEIVEAHGGTILAESAEESIMFTVRLPAESQKTV